MRSEETVGEKENQLAKRRKQEEADEKLKEMLKDEKNKEKKVEELEESESDSLSSQNQKGPGIKLTLSQEKEKSKQKSKDAKTVQKFVYIGRAPNYKARPKEKPSAKEKSCPWYKRDMFSKNAAENKSVPDCKISSTVDALSGTKNENSGPRYKLSSATESDVPHKNTVTSNSQIIELNTEDESSNLDTNINSKSKSMCKQKSQLNSSKSKVLSETGNNGVKSTSDISKKMTKSNKHKGNESETSDPSAGSKSDLPKIAETGEIKYAAVNQAIQNILHGTDSAIHQANVSLSDINLPKNNTQNLDSHKQLNLENMSANESVCMDISPVKYPDIVYSSGTLPKAYTAEEEKDFLILGINKDDMRPIAIPVPPPMSVLNFCSGAAAIPYSTLSQVTSRIITVPPPPLPVHNSTALSDGSYSALSKVDLSVPPPPLPVQGASHITVPPPLLPNQVSSHISVPPPPLPNQVNSLAISIPPPTLLPTSISSHNISVPPPTRHFSLLPTPNSHTNLNDYVSSYNIPFNRSNLDAMQYESGMSMQYFEGNTPMQYEGGMPINYEQKMKKFQQQSILQEIEMFKLKIAQDNLKIAKDKLKQKHLAGDNPVDKNLITVKPSEGTVVHATPAHSTVVQLDTSSTSKSIGVEGNTPMQYEGGMPINYEQKMKKFKQQSVLQEIEMIKLKIAKDKLLVELKQKYLAGDNPVDKNLITVKPSEGTVVHATSAHSSAVQLDTSSTSKSSVTISKENDEKDSKLKEKPSKSTVIHAAPVPSTAVKLNTSSTHKSSVTITKGKNEMALKLKKKTSKGAVVPAASAHSIAEQLDTSSTSMSSVIISKGKDEIAPELQEKELAEVQLALENSEKLKYENIHNSVANETSEMASSEKDTSTSKDAVHCPLNVKKRSTHMELDQDVVLENFNAKESVADLTEDVKFKDIAGNSTADETSVVAIFEEKEEVTNKDMLSESNVKKMSKPMKMDRPLEDSVKKSVADLSENLKCEDITDNSTVNETSDMVCSDGKDHITNIDDVLCMSNVKEVIKFMQMDKPVVFESLNIKQSIPDSKDLKCNLDNAANENSDLACSGVKDQNINKDTFCLSNFKYGARPMEMDHHVVLKDLNAKGSVADSTEHLKCEDIADNSTESKICDVVFTEGKDDMLCALNVKEVSKPLQMNEIVVLEDSNVKESITHSNEDLTCEDVDDAVDKTSDVVCSKVEDQGFNKEYVLYLKNNDGAKHLEMDQHMIIENPNTKKSVTEPADDLKCENVADNSAENEICDMAFAEDQITNKDDVLCALNVKRVSKSMQLNESFVLEDSNAKECIADSNENVTCEDVDNAATSDVASSEVEEIHGINKNDVLCLKIDKDEAKHLEMDQHVILKGCNIKEFTDLTEESNQVSDPQKMKMELKVNGKSAPENMNKCDDKLKSFDVKQPVLDECPYEMALQDLESCDIKNLGNLNLSLLHDCATSDTKQDSKDNELVSVKMTNTVSVLKDTSKISNLNLPALDDCRKKGNSVNQSPSAACLNLDLHKFDLIANAESVSVDEVMPKLESESNSNVLQLVLDENSQENVSSNHNTLDSKEDLNAVREPVYDDSNSDLCKLGSKDNSGFISIGKTFDEAMPKLENQSKNSNISQPVLDECSQDNFLQNFKIWASKGLNSVKKSPSDDQPKSNVCKLDSKANVNSASVGKVFDEAMPKLENQNSQPSQPVLDKLSEKNSSHNLESSNCKDFISVKEEPLDDYPCSDLFKSDGKMDTEPDLFNKEASKTISNVDKDEIVDEQNALLRKNSNYSQASLPESNTVLLIDLTEDSCDNEACSKFISPTRVESTNFAFTLKSGSCISGDATMKEHSNTYLSLDVKCEENIETAEVASNEIFDEQESNLKSEQFQIVNDEVMDSSNDLFETITATAENQDLPEITSKTQISSDLIGDSVAISKDSNSDIEELFAIEEPMEISKDSDTGDHKEDSDTDEYENEED